MTNNGTMASTETPDGAKRLSDDDLRKHGLALADECANLRGRLRTLTERRQAARGRLALSVGAFMAGVGPKVSDAQLRRDYIASSQKERADRAAGRTSAPRVEVIPGESYLDRAAASARNYHGDGDDFVRKRMRVGLRGRGAVDAGQRDDTGRTTVTHVQAYPQSWHGRYVKE